MYCESNKIRFSHEEYTKNLSQSKEIDSFKREKLINVSGWPEFKDFSFSELRELAVDLISELEEREIHIEGISFGEDREGFPLFYVHMDRVSRTYHESQDIPEEFEGLYVEKVIAGKFNF